MPLTIRISLSEKRSTTSQYENAAYGAEIEASGLELHTPDAIRDKAHELFVLARSAIQRQLLEPLPSEAASGDHHQNGNGHGRSGSNGNGNGRRRSYGRPSPEPTAKQKQLVRKLAAERGLDAESIGAICRRVAGVELRSCTKDDISKLIDALLEEQVS